MVCAPDGAQHFVAGIRDALKGMIAGEGAERSPLIVVAAESFDKAWFSNANRFPRDVQEGKCSAAGYWTACSLIDGWKGRRRVELSATTPVLAAIRRSAGYLFDLTIEFEVRAAVEANPNPICPDPFRFGLTDVSGLIDTIQNAWNASGLASRFRGRWGLECRQGHPPCVGGKSIEAAALVAMLAASRDPYGEHTDAIPGDLAPCPLYPRATVSDALDTRGATIVQPSEVQLKTVGLIPKKIYSAAQGELETEVSKIEGEGKSAQKCVSGSDNVYFGLEIERDLKTKGDVLDVMLEENRYLTRYNQKVSERWLG